MAMLSPPTASTPASVWTGHVLTALFMLGGSIVSKRAALGTARDPSNSHKGLNP